MAGRERALRVLIVDDEPDILSSLVELIAISIPSLEVVGARSGAEAVKRLREAPFDLLLTDFRMPGMNGLELLAQVNEIRPGTPAVMITAYPDLDVVLAAVNERRARGFLTKPVDPTKLIAAVHDVLLARKATELREAALLQAIRHGPRS